MLVQGNTPQSDVFDGNNQIAGSGYDLSNQIMVNGNTQAYDAENRQISTSFAAQARTISTTLAAASASVRAAPVAQPSSSTTPWEGFSSEYSTAANPLACTTCYLSADHLGGTGLVTDGGSGIVKASRLSAVPERKSRPVSVAAPPYGAPATT